MQVRKVKVRTYSVTVRVQLVLVVLRCGMLNPLHTSIYVMGSRTVSVSLPKHTEGPASDRLLESPV